MTILSLGSQQRIFILLMKVRWNHKVFMPNLKIKIYIMKINVLLSLTTLQQGPSGMNYTFLNLKKGLMVSIKMKKKEKMTK